MPDSRMEPIAKAICGLDWPKHFNAWESLVEAHRRLLVVASRDHGKTTFFDLLYPIRKLIVPGFSILVVSYSDAQVVKIVMGIRDAIEKKPFLKSLAAKNDEDWSRTRLKLRNGSTLDSLTFGSSGRGGHYDLILVDDPVKDFGGMNADDQEQYFLKSLVPMCKPDGQIIVTGNFVYDNDLIERIQKNNAYHTGLYPAISGGVPLWPEYWSLDKLMAREKEIGPYAFAREYLLQKISLGTQFFKRGMFKYYDTLPERMAKVMSIDPAISTKGDDTAIMVTGTGDDKKTRLLDYAKLKTDNVQAIIDEIFRLVKLYQVPYAQFETIGFQKLFKHLLYDEMRKQDLHFGIEEIRTHKKSKEARIMALQPKIEAGSLLFHPTKHEAVIGQFLAFPRGLNDDMIDALSFQMGKWDDPGPLMTEAPKSSFDWWRQQVPTGSGTWQEAMQL